MINEEKLKINLQQELSNLDKAVNRLLESYDECKNFKEPFNSQQDKLVDALTIRLARASDIYTQKILTNIVLILRENSDGFIDKVNICEKLGFVTNADDLIKLRDLRNNVAHDYEGNFITNIFNSTILYTPKLLASIDKTKQYIANKITNL